ncbi:aliphatic sulfonate ABC transporter substrate-binding protein [Aurantimicrobium sp. MWH-Uga1]|uniref:aliphatic sulfonate ABC transporter substrate-binding protein n=1 Tax=Aurantimicrobium sp. MWH-Uga1 TaxID=2079575 RepID=UPI000DF03561|nr:aliphatic sulfonate ABC transporter substrate-binding protein [Aurantimicrobium sp. MWH-Uga1]AXE54752.1 Putative aliphatic sulfonates-binding protein precursor [Aurantimicrobium sp. MWH-Uga1]
MKKKSLLASVTASIATLALVLTGCASEPKPVVTEEAAAVVDRTGETLNIDFATYNPLSLLIKNYGWLEEELAETGIKVNWVQSLSSADANAKLLAGALDVGSIAGSAALLARANGSPIKTIEIYTQPEWVALAVGPDSKIKDVADLEGKKVAARKGTDTYFFLLQALEEAGVDPATVTIENLAHADGKTALFNGSVDAWAGLDPILAGAETEGAQLIYRNVEFNSYGFLNATESFIADKPDVAQIVTNVYEQARQYAIANPDATYAVLAAASGLSVPVAKKVITERTLIDINPIPGKKQTKLLKGIGKVFVANGDVATQAQVDDALKTLYDTKFIKKSYKEIDVKATEAAEAK